MSNLWQKHATEQELKEYERLGAEYKELFAKQTQIINETLESFNIPYEPYVEDDGETWDDFSVLQDTIYSFTPPKNRQAEYLSLIGDIQSLSAKEDANIAKQINIVSSCMERYRDAINGSRDALLDDARAAAADFIEGMLKVTATVIEKGHPDDAPREMATVNIYRGGDFGSIKNIAEYWKIDIENDLQKIAEQAAKEYKKQAGKLFEQAYKETGGTGLALTEGNKEKQAQVVEDLIKSSTYTVLNNKLFNQYLTIQSQMLNIQIDGQMVMFASDYPVDVNRKNAPAVFSYVSLSYTGELAPKLAKLTAYDKSVLNAVCSICWARNQVFKVDDIYRVMNGYSEKKPTPAQHERILKALRKLKNTTIYIDYSQELEKGYIVANEETDERFISGRTEGHLLDIWIDTKTTNRGRKVDTVALLAPPILLAYSMAKTHPQIISIPIGMFNMDSISATDDNCVIREYLAKQVIQMKNGYRNNSNILYSTIFEECTIDVPTDPAALKTFMQRKRSDITRMLDEWKPKKDKKTGKIIAEGYIKDYKETKTGRAYTGVSISI